MFISLCFLVITIFVFRNAVSEDTAIEAQVEQENEIKYWKEIPEIERNRTQIGKENACIYMLVRNSELHEALDSIRQIEDRFNRRYRYPWVFLNDDYFTEEFKKHTSGMVSGIAEYGHIDPEVWNVPKHIDMDLYEERLRYMEEINVIYGGSRSYHNMCRYNSGNFFWHPLMLKYRYYWRVEPSIKFYCDQRYDPFEFMRLNDKLYGFVITIVEYKDTVPTLYKTVKEFLEKRPDLLHPDNGLIFATDMEPTFSWVDEKFVREFSLDGYNMCHFWSNFEIGDMTFFRSEAYSAFFNHLEESGGFYYERWGDAPVHTFGVLSMMNASQIHHFSDMGYYHPPFWRCPHDKDSFESGRCLCPEADDNVDFAKYSCLAKWLRHFAKDMLFEMAPQSLFV